MVNMEDCIRSISVNGKLDSTPKYSVTEAAKISQLSVHTLRYYDDLGLFPFLQRDANSKRLFSEADMQWVQLIECLRNSGMSLSDIKKYIALCLDGDSTLPERLSIIEKQESIIEQQMEDQKKQLELLRFKKNYYMKLLNKT